MMTRMFGFLPGVWAAAGPASSATTAISASKVEQILMVLRILVSSLDCTRFIPRAAPAPKLGGHRSTILHLPSADPTQAYDRVARAPG